MGFFHHEDHQEELQNAFSRTSTVLQQAATADDQNMALPRGGVSLGSKLDMFYDRYLALFSVNQMSTERVLAKLRHTVGGLSNFKDNLLKFRIFNYNNAPRDQTALMKNFKEARSARKVEKMARAEARRQNQFPDPQGILAKFDRLLQLVRLPNGFVRLPANMLQCILLLNSVMVVS